jgi:hypothetical protein
MLWTSENPVNAKFAEFGLGKLSRIPLPRTRVYKQGKGLLLVVPELSEGGAPVLRLRIGA